MDTTEGNKLIAKFMEVTNEISDLYYLPQFGHYFNSYGNIEYNEVFRSTELKYHSSWDWLMPVVEKIYLIGNNSSLTASMDFNEKPAYNNRKLATWLAVVEFIKWYNANK